MPLTPFAQVFLCFRQPNKVCLFIFILIIIGINFASTLWYYQTRHLAQHDMLVRLTQQTATNLATRLQVLDSFFQQIEPTHELAVQQLANRLTTFQAYLQGVYLLDSQTQQLQPLDTTHAHSKQLPIAELVTITTQQPQVTHLFLENLMTTHFYAARMLQLPNKSTIIVGQFAIELLTDVLHAKATTPALQLQQMATADTDNATIALQVHSQLPTPNQHNIATASIVANTPWRVVALSTALPLNLLWQTLLNSSLILLLLYGILRWQHYKAQHQQTLQQTNQDLTQQLETNVAELKREVEERNYAEQALRQSETRLRGIIDTAADCIVTINEHGLIESYNDACQEMFLYKQERILNQPLSQLLPHFKSVSHYSFNAINMGLLAKSEQETTIRHETEGLREDNSYFPVEFVVSEFHLQERLLFSGIIRDITDRKDLEKLLQSSIKKLQTTIAERTQDIKSLTQKLDLHERLANWQEGRITSQLAGIGNLKQRDESAFEHLLNIYMDLLEDYLEAIAFNKIPKRSTIIAFANRLGDEGGGPKDVLDIHLQCIEQKNKDNKVNNRRMKSYTVEGRLLVIEIMGHLVDYYRLHSASYNSDSH